MAKKTTKKSKARVAKKSTVKAKKPAKVEKVDLEEEVEVEIEAKRPTPGVYVYKPLKSKITECACGNKYIATRPKQRICFDCIREQSLVAR